MFQLTHRRCVFEKPALKSLEAVLEGSEVLLLRCKMPLRCAGKLMLKCCDKACQCHQQNQPQLNMNNPCSPTIGNFYNKHLDFFLIFQLNHWVSYCQGTPSPIINLVGVPMICITASALNINCGSASITCQSTKLLSGFSCKILASKIWVMLGERHEYIQHNYSMYLLGKGIICIIIWVVEGQMGWNL